MRLLTRDRTSHELHYEMDAPKDRGPKPERKFNFWVKRAQDFGGNVQGVCTDVRVDRAGTLVILGPEIRRFAPGTWLECNTSRAWEECGGE